MSVAFTMGPSACGPLSRGGVSVPLRMLPGEEAQDQVSQLHSWHFLAAALVSVELLLTHQSSAPVGRLGGREPHVLHPGGGAVSRGRRQSVPEVGQVGREGFGEAAQKSTI